MHIKYSIVRFSDLNFDARYGNKIRGYFANKYSERVITSNHRADGKLRYSYPLVQYKVINKIASICGIEEGAKEVIEMGIDTDIMKIEDSLIEVIRKEYLVSDENLGESEDYVSYEFIHPWLALNQSNKTLFEKSNEIEREEMLQKILIGNIISMSKGLNYNITKKLKVWIDLYQCSVNFKNIKMIGFKGNFKINFNIPDYLGIGKSVSRGFGTVCKVKENSFR